MGDVLNIRDFQLKKLETKAKEIMGRVIDYSEVARLGGPGGIDDLIIDTNHYHKPDGAA